MALTKPRLGQISTTVSSLSDPITILNGGASSANVDVGFLVNRANGLVSNVALYWNESGNTFITTFTSNSGATNTNLRATSYANITTGMLYANAVYTINGLYWAGNNNVISTGGGGSAPAGVTGQVQYNDANTLNGTTYLYYNKSTGQVTANANIASTSTTTGTFIVTGGAGISGNLISGGHGQFSGLFNESTTASGVFIGNAGSGVPSPRIGFFNGNTTQNWQIDNFGGTFRWFTPGVSRMTLNSAGDLSIPSTSTATSTATGALVVGGGAGIGGAVYVGGILSVAGDITVTGNLTVNGTTTNINTTNLVVEDKNMVLADVATPTDTTADGAGITVKGATDKTFNWVDATDAWTSSEDLNLLTGKQYEINGTGVLTATTLGSGVINSSLTSLGTITSLAATTAVATNFSTANAVISGGSLNNTTVGATTHTTGRFTTVTATTVNAGTIGNTGATLTGTLSTATQTNITSVGTLTGLTTSGNIVPSANLTYNLGSTTAWWNIIYGKAVQAQYADLAERYESDAGYSSGTVVIFGGNKEITVTTQDHDPRVAGVVSTNPAYLMNASSPGLPVALQGRVPCQVQGPVAKGDVLVTSTTPGVAQRIDNSKFLPGCVVGKALESINTNTTETIEVVVGRF